jgi:hypothetical protein
MDPAPHDRPRPRTPASRAPQPHGRPAAPCTQLTPRPHGAQAPEPPCRRGVVAPRAGACARRRRCAGLAYNMGRAKTQPNGPPATTPDPSRLHPFPRPRRARPRPPPGPPPHPTNPRPRPAAKSVFTHDGPTLLLTTPEWTIAVPYAHDTGTQPQGVLIVGTDIYKFKAPRIKARRGGAGNWAGRAWAGQAVSGWAKPLVAPARLDACAPPSCPAPAGDHGQKQEGRQRRQVRKHQALTRQRGA